jgi:hypothetical protein
VASLDIYGSNFTANGVLPPQPDDDPEDPALTENGAALVVMGNKVTNDHPVNLTVGGAEEQQVHVAGSCAGPYACISVAFVLTCGT